MFNYSNSIEKKIEKDPDSVIDSFKKKVYPKLKTLEFRTELQGNVIQFKRIIRNTTHLGQNKIEALKLLREGRIKIEKLEIQRIRITWVVKLDALLFISIMIGIVAGFFFGFASSSFLNFLIVAIFSPSIPYCVGYFLIKEEIDEIIYNALDGI